MIPHITHTPNTVHLDGLAVSPDEAHEIAAQLIVHAHAAEGEARIHRAFRLHEHAREKFAHDADGDQRELGERLEN